MTAPTTERTAKSASHLLSLRELQILRGLLDGLSDIDLAVLLGMSVIAVSVHIETAKRKLGAADRMRAVALALRDGLITYPDDDEPTGAASAPGSATDRVAARERPQRPFAGIAPQAVLIARIVGRGHQGCAPAVSSCGR